MNPRLSILLPAMRGYDSVLAALDAWSMQTCRDRIEVLVLCPEAPGSSRTGTLPPGQVIVPVGRADLHHARAIGIQHATGDYIMLAEDHCLPDPDWAQAILERLEEDWDAVGSVLRPGDRSSSWTEASFLIGYGEWMAPMSGGPARVLCGWNGTIRARLLKRLDANLAEELLVGAFLVRRLQQQGHRFYLEDRARMRHFDPPGWRFELFLLFLVGLAFGAMRTRHWALPVRLLWVPAAPAIAFLHWKRAFLSYRRAGSQAGLRPAACVAAMALAGAWGLGESIGSLVGIDRVIPHIWRTEIKPVSRAVVARSTAQEALTCS